MLELPGVTAATSALYASLGLEAQGTPLSMASPPSLLSSAFTRFAPALALASVLCGKPVFAAEPKGLPSGATAAPATPGWALDDIIGQIDCRVRTTLGDGTELSDNDLLRLLKCEDVTTMEIELEDSALNLTVGLASGTKISRQVLLDFGDKLQGYALRRGINVRTLLTKPGFWERNWPLMAGLLIVLVLVFKESIPGIFKPRRSKPITTRPKTRFDDIGGLRKIKAELRDLAREIANRAKIEEMGGTVPRGVLFSGPPGSGKTMTARAIAGEIGCPFISISGSEMISKYMGSTSEAIRELFATARKAARKTGTCIIFIDELDAIGSKRTTDGESSSKEDNAIVNQLLVEMDGFHEEDQGVIVLAATNFPENLDQALTRPGRFDRSITFVHPDQEGRMEILRILTRDTKLADDVRFEAIASIMVGRSGAEVKNVVDVARLLAFHREEASSALTAEDFRKAVDRVLVGLESDIALDPEQKNRVAHHEAGHAVIAALDRNVTVERVSIVPRGNALGVTLTPPFGEKFLFTEAELMHELKVLLGGILAERLIFGSGSTGVGDDLERVTEKATEMVVRFGMTRAGGDLCDARSHEDEKASPRVRRAIDGIVNAAKEAAMNDLRGHEDILRDLARRLVVKQTIEYQELRELFGKIGS